MDSSNLEEQENQGSAASATAANSNMNMRGGARGTCILLDANGADITNNKEAASNKGGESLREAFERFRREKQRAAKVEKKSGTAAKKRLNDTEEGREKLRRMFLDRAKSYLGKPYAQKYHDPSSELYHSDVFLDCCGLIRQAQHDLQEYFGFRLPRWNQAFMFDTLPSQGDDWERLKPGDLVFYEAEYTKPNMRAQRFGMVHVEIFTGGDTGEKTLGSRWNDGTVSFFDSYKFSAKVWTNVKYHFRSIDPWLKGMCEPAHPEYWKGNSFGSRCDDRNSIFALADDVDDGGQNEPAEQEVE
eukprot:gb/GECG01011359.1/.p1 GENE.gb/GECG01011359.1/~~gb/GECG01011359.1/.p1  ORF type:complete len:301 (+),score=47.12 gb/GECG01011359.1/:1-903(+)